MLTTPVAHLPNLLIRLLLAPECATCGVVLEFPLRSPICGACWRAIVAIAPPFCARCGDGLASWRAPGPLCARCRRHPPAVTLARSAGLYDGTLREAIHVLKYGRRRALAPSLGRLMRDAGRDTLAGADAVVPVPLHPWRGLRRGFNQADDLASALGLPVWRVLRRRRLGRPQAELSGAMRARNVRGAFALRRGPPWLHARLSGRTLVLVDDVMTTGATLDACARVLLAAGVRQVRALTAARASTGRRAPPRQTPAPSTAPRR